MKSCMIVMSQPDGLKAAVDEYKAEKEALRKYLSQLDAECKKKFGPNNRYIRPAYNPYIKFKDVITYRKLAVKDGEKLHVDRNCKLINLVSQDTSTDGRYFTRVYDPTECEKVNGIWDPTATSRINKYDKGVCWTTEENKVCGKAVNPDMLRPFPRLESDLRSAENQCAMVKGCKLEFFNPERSAYTYDCKPVSAPPPPEDDATKAKKDKLKNLPTVPLKDGLEQFIYDYYSNNIAGRPPPPTTQLMGVGNRCVAQPVDPDASSSTRPASSRGSKSGKSSAPKSPAVPQYPPLDYVHKEYRDFRKYDPNKPIDARVLKERFNMVDPKKFAEYKTHYNMVKRYGLERYKSMYTGDKAIYTNTAHDWDKIELERDAPLEVLFGTNKPKADDEAAAPPGAVNPPVKVKGLAPSIPQSVVNTIMKYVALTDDPKRGMIAWHSTGSGKTCTATGVMDSFWDTDREIIFASSLDALASNPDYKFHECGMNLYPRWHKKTLEQVGEEFKKRGVRFLSFAKLSNRVEKFKQGDTADKDYVDLNNSVLIIDEVHNLFRPLLTQKKEYERLEKELTDPKRYKNLKVVILTATPGDTIADIMKLLNIVRTPSDPEIVPPNIESKDSLDSFKNAIRGMVSFFDMSADTTKFPVVHDSQEFIKVPLSNRQFAKYVEAYKGVKATQKNYDALAKANQLGRYWEPARKYANMMFTFDKDMQLSEFSGKMPALLAEIAKHPKEKQYVYSSFYTKMGYGGQGIVGIAKEMEKAGYKKFTVKEALEYNKKGTLPPKGKRFGLAITTEVGAQLDAILRIYNHPDNKNGELIHVLLASQGFNEGIDLKAVRHIHFFEPLITMASDKQTLGRAARYCSHAQLDRDAGEWNVHIHRYMMEKPLVVGITAEEIQQRIDEASEKLKKDKKNKDLKAEIDRLKAQKKEMKGLDVSGVANIEEAIFKESRDRMKQIFTIYACMKEAAVDCRILNKFHSMTGTEVKCEGFYA